MKLLLCLIFSITIFWLVIPRPTGEWCTCRSVGMLFLIFYVN